MTDTTTQALRLAREALARCGYDLESQPIRAIDAALPAWEPAGFEFGDPLSLAPMAAPAVQAEPVAYSLGIKWHPNVNAQSEQVIKVTRHPQPKYGFIYALYAATTAQPPAVMLNGLTESETSQTASVAGLTQPAPTAQAPRALTDAEIDTLWRAPMSADWEHREFARAIERAHGIQPAKGEGE